MLLLVMLVLLVLIASLTRTGDASVKQGKGAGVETGVIGEEKDSSVDGGMSAAEKEDDAQLRNNSSQTEKESIEPPPQGSAPPEALPTNHTEDPSTDKSKPETQSPEVEPDEVPKGTRVIPLFSEPSAASAPTLETSNPFLDAGKANSIVFVIDKSSSMSQSFRRVIAALYQSIDRLSKDQAFQVIFFDDVPRQNPSFSSLVKATEKNKDAMKRWIDSHIMADGGTEPLAAVRLAIELRPNRIIILSDGEFNPEYVEEITKYNSSSPKPCIRIDCIGLNEVVESLQQIARKNGPGIYYQAR